MSDGSHFIGIDFGTTTSSMARYDPKTGRAEIIKNFEGEDKTPSVVYYGERETLVGKPAEERIEEASADAARREEVVRRAFTSVKRELHPKASQRLPDGRRVYHVDVVAEILGKLKRDAEELVFGGREVGRAVITCPAEFKGSKRRLIEEAGRWAGFGEVELLFEPEAAALAYVREGYEAPERVLVYDLGGGTFDLAVLVREGESFRVALPPKGIERCGGDDFDRALYGHCEELALEKLDRTISPKGMGYEDKSFLRECRRRKENLSNPKQERARFGSYLASEDGPVFFEHEVDRGTFEGLIEPYVEDTVEQTRQMLEEARSKGHEPDAAVLIGGSTRVPLVGRVLGEAGLPVRFSQFDKRDVAVALGAAYHAGILWSAVEQPPTAEVPDLAGLDGAGAGRALAAEGLKLGDRYEAPSDAAAKGEIIGQSPVAGERVIPNSPVSITVSSGSVSRTVNLAGRFVLTHAPTVGRKSSVWSVAVSRDGSIIASGDNGGQVRLWDVETGEALRTFSGHSGAVRSVALSPDGRFLASGGDDRTNRLWDVNTGKLLNTLSEHSRQVFSVTTSPDGRLLASADGAGEIMLWDMSVLETLGTLTPPSRALLARLSGHSGAVRSVAVSPDGRFLASGGDNRTTKLWDVNSGETLNTLSNPGWWVLGRVLSVAVSPDGSYLVTGDSSGKIRLWDLTTGKAVRTFSGHSGAVRSVAVSPDGRFLASGGDDQLLKLWDANTDEMLQMLTDHRGRITSVVISPDGLVLASGDSAGAIKIWRTDIGAATQVSDEPPDLPD